MTEEQQNDILDTGNRNAKPYFPPSGFCVPSKTKYFDYDSWLEEVKEERLIFELYEDIKRGMR